MDRSKLINDLKMSLKNFLKFADVTPDATLADGTNLSTNGIAFEMGVEVFKINSDGSLSPLEDGDYTLTDGTPFSIMEGKISSYGTPDEMAEVSIEISPEEGGEEEMMPEMEPSTETTDTSGMEERISALEEQLASLMEIVQGLTENSSSMMKKVEKLLKSPGSEPAKFEKIEKKEDKESIDTRSEIAKIMELSRKQNKND